MNLYGIETEGELVSGCFLKLHSRLGREKVEIADIIRRILAKIRENFRTKFFDQFDLSNGDLGADEDISEEMQRKASAWYYVAYSHRNDTNVTENVQGDSPIIQFTSFAWLVDDVMLSIRLRKAFQAQEAQSVVTSISESVFKVFEKERDTLLHGFEDRIRKKNLIAEAIPGVPLALFGSSATLLFRPDSDLDICILHPVVIAQRGELERDAQIAALKTLLPVMKNFFQYTRLVEAARVPVSICELHSYPRKSSGRVQLKNAVISAG